MTGWKHGKLMSCAPALVILLWAGQRGAQAQLTTTTIQDTVYSANGNAAVGTVIVSWPAFATAANGTVAAGSTTVTIGADGFLSLNLAPNAGATPAGTYYTVVYHLSDGTVSKEFWLVPAVAQTTISGIRTQVTPAAVAMLTASKAYVDSSIAGLSGTYVAVDGGSMTGPLVLSGDPAAASQASTKHYVDAQISTLAGTIGWERIRTQFIRIRLARNRWRAHWRRPP
jgi:hypothetical protein